MSDRKVKVYATLMVGGGVEPESLLTHRYGVKVYTLAMVGWDRNLDV